MGTGHVMRCLALAQAWQDSGGCVIFVMRLAPRGLTERLTSEGCRVFFLDERDSAGTDVEQTVRYATRFEADWVVVDGYQFDAQYQVGIKESGLRLAWIDDYGHAASYTADIVLNQNLYAAEISYSNCSSNTQLLLGPRFVLLRRDFLTFGNVSRATAAGVRKILVTLGGSDPHNVSLRVMQALNDERLKDCEAVVIAGPANSFVSELAAEAVSHMNSSVSVLVGTSDMPKKMAWADLAVSAAGTTVYELAFMGVPSLLIEMADNQNKNMKAFRSAGLAVCLGRQGDLTAPDIAEALALLARDSGRMNAMGKRGRELVDGAGADRFVTVLRGERVRLRTMSGQAERLVWERANDTVVSAMSFSSHTIEWNEHEAWYKAKMIDPRCRFFMAVDSRDEAVGHIRFDLEDSEALVSITVPPSQRGKGFGREILRLAAEKLFATSRIQVIRGLIKKENEASIRAFLKAGFRSGEDRTVNESVCAQFVLTRKDVQ